MGNFNCFEDVNSFIIFPQEVQTQSWKSFVELECIGIKQNVSWADSMLRYLHNVNHTPDTNLTRDMFIMNKHFKATSHSQSSDSKKYKKNVQKVLRRTGMTEEDIMDAFSKDGQQSFSQSINCSELSNTPSYLYQEKNTNGLSLDNRTSLERQIDYFTHLTDLIVIHLEKPNDLGQMVKHFQQHFLRHSNNQNFNIILFEFQQFSRILYLGIVHYYNLMEMKRQDPDLTALVNEDTLINFAVNQILQNEEIYYLMYVSLKNTMQDQINQTEKNLKRLKNYSCQEAQISEQFRLENEKEPYLDSIRVLKRIEHKKGPSSKIKIIIKCSKKIMEQIRNANVDRGASLILQSDDLLPIMQYIIIKAQIKDIDVHLSLVDKLLSNRMLASTCGYYLTTMQVALESLDKL